MAKSVEKKWNGVGDPGPWVIGSCSPHIVAPVYAVVEVWNGYEVRFEASTPDGVIEMIERHRAYQEAKRAARHAPEADAPHVVTEAP